MTKRVRKPGLSGVVSRGGEHGTPAYVVFEGIDGAGKSTQLKIMAEWFRTRDITPVELCEPTYGKFGAAARAMIASGVDMPVPEQIALFTRDRRAHVRSRILPLLSLIRDESTPLAILQHRYYLSAPVYQWLNDNQAMGVLRDQQAIAPRPDIVLLLDVPAELAYKRLRARDKCKRTVTVRCLELLRRRYLQFAGISGEPVVIVNGRGSTDAVARRLWTAVETWPSARER